MSAPARRAPRPSAVCFFGDQCTRPQCHFRHPNGRSAFPAAAAAAASSSSSAPSAAAASSSSSSQPPLVSLDPCLFVDQAAAAELTCAICTDVCSQPLSLPCSHLFCQPCLLALPQPRTCPECRASLDLQHAIVNQFVVRRIENMAITCPLQIAGCIAKLTPGKDNRNIHAHVCEMKSLAAADIDVVVLFAEMKAMRAKVAQLEADSKKDEARLSQQLVQLQAENTRLAEELQKLSSPKLCTTTSATASRSKLKSAVSPSREGARPWRLPSNARSRPVRRSAACDPPRGGGVVESAGGASVDVDISVTVSVGNRRGSWLAEFVSYRGSAYRVHWKDWKDGSCIRVWGRRMDLRAGERIKRTAAARKEFVSRWLSLRVHSKDSPKRTFGEDE